MKIREAFSKIAPYLGVWSRMEGLILLIVAVGVLLPLGGEADVVIAVALSLWGLTKLFGGVKGAP